MKTKLVGRVRQLLGEVDPSKLRLSDLWYIIRILEVAKK